MPAGSVETSATGCSSIPTIPNCRGCGSHHRSESQMAIVESKLSKLRSAWAPRGPTCASVSAVPCRRSGSRTARWSPGVGLPNRGLGASGRPKLKAEWNNGESPVCVSSVDTQAGIRFRFEFASDRLGLWSGGFGCWSGLADQCPKAERECPEVDEEEGKPGEGCDAREAGDQCGPAQPCRYRCAS